jgi:hypothetical protein
MPQGEKRGFAFICVLGVVRELKNEGIRNLCHMSDYERPKIY